MFQNSENQELGMFSCIDKLKRSYPLKDHTLDIELS